MGEELYLVAGADTYQLHDLTPSRWSLGLAGIGMPPVKHVTQRAPLQDGSTRLYTYLQERHIDVALVQRVASAGARWTAWAELLGYLVQFDGLILRAVRDTGDSFDLDVVYEAGAEFDSRQVYPEHGYTCAIRLLAHDPVWRATDPTALSVGIPVVAGAAVLPCALPATLGSTSINTDIAVSYSGTWRAYPQIDIRGPIEDPLVQNVTTGEELQLDGAIPDGEIVRIDLAELAKTVINISTGDNWMPYLTTDSDLATWHLAPAPEAPAGVNDLHISGINGGGNTLIAVRWYPRFVGI